MNKETIKSKGALTLISLFLLFGTLQAQETRLPQYLETAAKNNPGLRSSFKSYQSALQRVPQLGALPDPEISFGYFVSPPETRVGPQIATFSVSQMFPWRGSLDHSSEVAALQAKAKYEAFEAQKSLLYFQVRHTWYSLFQKKRESELTEENLKTLRSWEDLALQKYEVGKASMVDVLRIRMEIRKMENKLALLEDQLNPLKSQFNQLLGQETSNAIQLPDSISLKDFPMEKESLEDSIRQRDPGLQKLKMELMAAGEKAKASESMGGPSIGVGLNYTIVGERSDMDVADNGKDIFMPMLKLRLPLYRNKYKSMVQEARLEEESIQMRQEDRNRELSTMTDDAYVAYDDATRRLELFKAQLQDARHARSLLMEQFTTGKEGFEEILRIQRMIYENEWKLVQARMDRNKAVAKFKQLGNLQVGNEN